MSTEDVVVLDRIRFGYRQNAPPTLALEALHIARGERVFLRGPSGSGKSTLLSLMAGILTPWSGQISLLGQPLHALRGGQRDALRATHLGVIFQMFNLVPYLSVMANVTLPCRFSAPRARRVSERGDTIASEAERLLRQLGLDDSLHQRLPTHL
ncbi:MAG: ATP-binding cassette domain-containing protein, partial [Pseudomonadota bacterium]